MHTILDYIFDAIFWLWPGKGIYDRTFFLIVLAIIIASLLMGDIAYAVFFIGVVILGIVIDAMFPNIHNNPWFMFIEFILIMVCLAYMVAIVGPEFMSLVGK